MKTSAKLVICILSPALIFCITFLEMTNAADITPSELTGWVAPLNPAYAQYLQDVADGKITLKTASGFSKGYVPTQVDFNNLTKDQGFLNFTPIPIPFQFPASYDLRDYGKVTAVRDQNPCLSCWTFAAYASLESYLSPHEIWDFSEHHMMNTNGFDGLTGECGNGIGNPTRAAAYLARWSGPVDEDDDPHLSETSPPNPMVLKHVQEVLDLPLGGSMLDMVWIKWAIMEYGAVSAIIRFENEYYDPQLYTYYQDQHILADHGVTIIGWDDQIERSQFPAGENGPPPGDGAFIVKNSWGPDWGDDGYFYVSYHDAVLGKKVCNVFTAEPVTNYDRIYQYDPLGRVEMFKLSALDSAPTSSANVFTADGFESIVAVSFYTRNLNVEAEIKIYLDPPAGSPINPAGPDYAMTTDKILVPGYHTVTLDEKVAVGPGQKFSVVITPYAYDRFGKSTAHPAYIEYPKTGNSSNATANPGESYVKQGDSEWHDLTTLEVWDYGIGQMVTLTNGNVCVKAFTTLRDLSYLGGIKKIEGTSRLAWKIVNEEEDEISLQPVAAFYRKKTNLPGNPPGFHKVGTTAIGDYYIDASGVTHNLKKDKGWVKIPRGKAISVYSKPQIPAVANWVSYNAFKKENGQKKLLSNRWRFEKIFSSYLHVVSTTPESGKVVNPDVTISIRFDEQLAPGPGLHKIKIASIYETKRTIAKVNGNELLIYPESPLYLSDVPGGIQWEIRLQRDAVTDMNGNPLEKDFTWSFSTKENVIDAID